MNISEILDDIYTTNEAICVEVEAAVITYAIQNFPLNAFHSAAKERGVPLKPRVY